MGQLCLRAPKTGLDPALCEEIAESIERDIDGKTVKMILEEHGITRVEKSDFENYQQQSTI